MPRPSLKTGALVAVFAYFFMFVLNSAPVATGLPSEWDRLTAALSASGTTPDDEVADAATTSQKTVKGKGDFADLAVTVSQTADLVNQSIAVSWQWSGDDKHATLDAPGENRANFMQIMQCWGDTTPDRTQCQFGSYQQGDTGSASRQIYPGSLTGLKDDPRYYLDDADSSILPANTDYHSPGSPAESYFVPFRPVPGQGDTVKGVDVTKNPFYGSANTNEIPYAATGANGRGFTTFETLTYRESNGLGCGDILTSGANKGKPRNCWLVVVPRDTTEVDGRSYTTTVPRKLQSSPLSATNWAHRIVVPLGFAPVGQPCPINAKQESVGGVESATEAVLRWQPALCKNGGAVYSFSQLGDAVAENALVANAGGTESTLSLLNAPIDPAQVPSDRSLVYAPITLSGLGIVATIERQPRVDAPVEVAARRSERITDLNLTPRLVTKLLTQSYQAGVDPSGATYLASNPLNIGNDPDFLAVNPEFKDLQQDSVQILLPSSLSKTFDTLWRWIAGDDDARDFLAGLPDPWGMTVNPFYQGLAIPQEGLPKLDPFCRRGPVNGYEAPPLCVFDQHPYTQDMHEAARLTARGDSLARQWSSPATDPLPIVSKKIDPPQPGGRQVIGVADTATAKRYQLVTAKLRNSAGQFVAPTEKSLLAGAAAMTPTAVPGVLSPNPTTTARDAYPLTAVTYAVSAPNQLTELQAKDYATFVRFAVSSGQTPGSAAGTLPDGYAPLPKAMRDQARKVADQIQARVGPAKPATGGNGGSGGKGSGGSGGGSGSGSSGNGGSGGVATTPVVPPTTPTGAAVLPVSNPATQNVLSRTPGDPLVATRYAFLIALTLGVAAAVLGPLMPRLAQRLGL